MNYDLSLGKPNNTLAWPHQKAIEMVQVDKVVHTIEPSQDIGLTFVCSIRFFEKGFRKLKAK